MNQQTVTKLLTTIVVLLFAISAIIAYGLGCMNAALTGHRDYSVALEGHTYKVFMYGSSISAVHDPNCSCLKKTDKDAVGPMDILESPTVKEQ